MLRPGFFWGVISCGARQHPQLSRAPEPGLVPIPICHTPHAIRRRSRRDDLPPGGAPHAPRPPHVRAADRRDRPRSHRRRVVALPRPGESPVRLLCDGNRGGQRRRDHRRGGGGVAGATTPAGGSAQARGAPQDDCHAARVSRPESNARHTSPKWPLSPPLAIRSASARYHVGRRVSLIVKLSVSAIAQSVAADTQFVQRFPISSLCWPRDLNGQTRRVKSVKSSFWMVAR